MAVAEQPSNIFQLLWKILYRIVLPVIAVAGIYFLPRDVGSFFIIFFVVYYMQLCINLTFEGFQRESRYHLSQNHPILNIIISYTMVISAIFLMAPIALFLKAYSYFVSPDHKEDRTKFRYALQYLMPLFQAILTSIALYIIYLRY